MKRLLPALVLVAVIGTLGLRSPQHGQAATPQPLVACLDTGVNWLNPLIAARMQEPGYTAPWLATAYPNLPAGMDNAASPHGTAVCSQATQHTVGYPIKVCSWLGACADSTGPDVDGVVAGLQQADAVGAKVVNASITSELFSQSIQDEVCALAAKGVIVVAAAGNTGLSLGVGGTGQPETVAQGDLEYPLGATNCMIVVGGDDNDGGQWVTHPLSTRSDYVDVTAPYSGTMFPSCLYGFVTGPNAPCPVLNADGSPAQWPINGTSNSTPYVTDVIVQMLEANPNLNSDQVRILLRQTATPLADCTAAQGCGAGHVNAQAAITAAAAYKPPTPTPTPIPTTTPTATPTPTRLSLAPYPSRFALTNGQPFSYQFMPVGGTGPYSFVQSNGTLPFGLTLSTSGLLSGTPHIVTAPASYFLGVWVFDTAGHLYASAAYVTVQ